MGFAEHLAAGAALAFAARSATHAGGWPLVPKSDDAAGLPSLSIVVPARDEERGIERCVRSLCAQSLPDCEVIVVDDRSSDATRAILRRLEAAEPRLRVVDGRPLPEGWVGKPWALNQGTAVARGDWVLFTDADSWHAPQAAASALRFALAQGADALSLVWEIELETFWERAVLPSILGMIVLATGPVSDVNDPAKPENAIASGAFILVRRAAFEALGGHYALRARIAEDLEFARLIKRDGRFRFLIAEGRELVRVRMYRSFAEIWDGFTKNVFVGSNGNVAAALAGAAFLSLLSWVPPALAARAAVRRRPLDLLESLAASALVMATSAWGLGLRGADRRLAYGAPLGLAVLAAITVNSTVRVLSGHGVEWRGRRYDPR